jgi:asparagine synthase (glutamine-hydrolysing)
MCGLFGQLGSLLSEPRQRAVLEALQGRGPDDHGLYLEQIGQGGDQWLSLLHTRLAIQDLSPLGHQPMASPAGDLWVAFNGEIYNQWELRQQLQSAGAQFRSSSDTEVLLQGYRHWGQTLWGRLNGIFAVALWDRARGQLTLARDSCGVKPMLWQRGAAGLVFASELSAFEAAGLASRKQLSVEGLRSYALWGAVAAPHCLLQGVEVFPAGHYMVCTAHGRTATEGKAFAQQPQPFEAPLGPPRPLADLLTQAVARQAIGDRQVGLFLSGGLDSGLLAALLRRMQQGPIHSLAVGFDGLPGAVDETDLAAVTAAHLGLVHQRVLITANELQAAFDPFLEAIDQPSIDGFNSFLVTKAARASGMVVAFSGLGADELFYGYAHMAWRSPRRRFACRRIPASGLAPWSKRRLMGERARRCAGGAALAEECLGYLQDTLLRDSDAVTMAQGLELRVPFLDPDLIAFARHHSADEHLAAGPKTLLRQQAHALLPAGILQGPKRGFNLALAPWLSSDPRFAPRRLIGRLRPFGIPAQAIWRSWGLMQLTPRRWSPYWRWVVLSEWLRESLQ